MGRPLAKTVFKGPIAVLNAAIWAQTCTYCGATSGNACNRKTRGDHPNSSTIVPHMDRVRAAHIALKAAK